MKKLACLVVLGVGLAGAGFATQSEVEKEPEPPPAARKIPAITTDDRFPCACVDCHVNYPEMNMDTRFSTLMKQWNNEVDPKLVAKAQAFAPSGLVLKGKHPVVAEALKDIPAGCLKCHGKGSKVAPPLSQMVHVIHLTGGEENHFLTIFQGECTHCHKLNLSTGQWSMPSGPER